MARFENLITAFLGWVDQLVRQRTQKLKTRWLSHLDNVSTQSLLSFSAKELCTQAGRLASSLVELEIAKPLYHAVLAHEATFARTDKRLLEENCAGRRAELIQGASSLRRAIQIVDTL